MSASHPHPHPHTHAAPHAHAHAPRIAMPRSALLAGLGARIAWAAGATALLWLCVAWALG
ncbi:hypothetical protein [Azoarcus olearius]|nr:hypothetical protein [Azoarcus olearius]